VVGGEEDEGVLDQAVSGQRLENAVNLPVEIANCTLEGSEFAYKLRRVGKVWGQIDSLGSIGCGITAAVGTVDLVEAYLEIEGSFLTAMAG
jgi:hypothetical protein